VKSQKWQKVVGYELKTLECCSPQLVAKAGAATTNASSSYDATNQPLWFQQLETKSTKSKKKGSPATDEDIQLEYEHTALMIFHG